MREQLALSLMPSIRASTSRVWGHERISLDGSPTEDRNETHSLPLFLLNLLVLDRPHKRVYLKRHGTSLHDSAKSVYWAEARAENAPSPTRESSGLRMPASSRECDNLKE